MLDLRALYEHILGALPDANPNGDVRVKCLFHTDTEPSLVINLETGIYHCFGCNAKGNAQKFLQEVYSVSTQTARKWFEQAKHDVQAIPQLIPKEQASLWHEWLLNNEKVLDFLTRKGGNPPGKGLTIETICEFLLGWDGERITIPIPNAYGQIVNIRRYHTTVKRAKFINFAENYGEARFYPMTALDTSTIWLMEGEWDCLLARQLGLNAVTQTAGTGTWKQWWNDSFKDKIVYIVYDTDRAGRNGAQVVAKSLAPVVKQVRDVCIPVANGDFSDWILQHGGTVEELERIARNTTPVPKTGKLKTQLYDLKSPEDETVSLRQLIDSFHYKVTDNGPRYTTTLSVPKHILTDAVIRWFQKRGAEFIWVASESQGYLFYEGRRYMLKPNNAELLSMLQTVGGINAQDSEGRLIISALCNCATFAKRVELKPWIYGEGLTIWWFIQNDNQDVIVIKPNSITIENNGTTHFQDYAGDAAYTWFEPFELDLHVDKQEALALLYDCVVRHLAVSQVRKEIVIAWFLSMFLAHLSSIKPGLRLWGDASSGKSTILQLMFWLLYGSKVRLLPTFTTASLWRKGLTEPALFIDNQNVEEITEDLRTFLDLAATGGKRIIAKDTQGRRVVEQKVHSLVAVSGLDAFLEQDVLTRYFEVEAEIDLRRTGDFFPVKDRERLLQNRPKILSGIVKLLAEDILPFFEAASGRQCVRVVRELETGKERVSEYLSMMGAWGEAISRYEPRLIRPVTISETLQPIKTKSEQIVALVKRWSRDIRATTLETQLKTATTVEWWETFRQQVSLSMNQIVVHRITKENIEEVVIATTPPLTAQLIKHDDQYIGIRGTPIELLNALRWTARQVGVRLPWKSTRKLGASYRYDKDAWQLSGWKRQRALSSSGNPKVKAGVSEKGTPTTLEVHDIYWPEELAIPKTRPQVETDE